MRDSIKKLLMIKKHRNEILKECETKSLEPTRVFKVKIALSKSEMRKENHRVKQY
jgi:hypothetical protein